MADQAIYNSIPKHLPGNVASEGPEAYAFIELGDGVVFTPGTGGVFEKVSVVMSDWACEHGHWYVPVGAVAVNGDGPCVSKPGAKFSQSVTLKLYSVSGANTPGALLGSTTEFFSIPFRPSSDAIRCPGGDGTRWYNDQDKTCYHGLALPIDFNVKKLSITIPADNRAIVTLSFDSSDYGPHPQRPSACNSQPAPDNDNCPYDSLNISTDSGGFDAPPVNVAFTGSFLDPDSIFVNYASAANACPGNTTTHQLALDPGCWTGFHPQIQVTPSERKKPATKALSGS